MRLYRLAWVDLTGYEAGRIADTAPWGPLHVPLTRQGGGRFDNPRRYAALYAARQRRAAYGEVFGDERSRLTPATFTHQRYEGVTRCMVTLELADGVPLCDLDDPRTLVDHDLRPSQVVLRDRETTQEAALGVWLRRDETGHVGLSWWSYHNPAWTVCMLWSDRISDGRPEFDALSVVEIRRAHLDDPDLMVAADRCRIELRP